jgi:hypothetical protein
MLPSDRLQPTSDVIAQPSGDHLVLFHMASGNYYSLNELGARIWELCDGSRQFSEVINVVESEYDAPREIILADAQTLAADLIEKDLLIVGSDDHAVSG